MPSTDPERQARWPGMDTEAIDFLESRGFTIDWPSFTIRPPRGHVLDEREDDAVTYLFEEFDYGYSG